MSVVSIPSSTVLLSSLLIAGTMFVMVDGSTEIKQLFSEYIMINRNTIIGKSHPEPAMTKINKIEQKVKEEDGLRFPPGIFILFRMIF